MWLFDWGVSADVAGGRRVTPVGVSDLQERAQEQMVQALRAVPAGVTARGWVMVMSYVPSACGYQRHEFAVRAERDADGGMLMIAGGPDA
jgi:hypothetical protein